MTVLNLTAAHENEANPPGPDGTYAHIGSQGGTEYVARQILERCDPELLKRFKIIHSRVRDWMFDDLDGRIPLLVMHDTWDDPENGWMKSEKLRKRFERIVFVSHYQQATFNMGLGVPYSDGIVVPNAISAIEPHEKPTDAINLIYHTTPHRGLEILVPVFEAINEEFPETRLDVYSSFSAYGWKQRDAQYEDLFERCRAHQAIGYHGFQPNGVIRGALARSHVYGYPCIWPETSCISVIEAMSAGCEVVTSNLSALPETCAGFASMYGYHEDPNVHATRFYQVLHNSIKTLRSDAHQNKLRFQKLYFDNTYDWETRTVQWNRLLEGLAREHE